MSFLKRIPLFLACAIISACSYNAGRDSANPHLFESPQAARVLIEKTPWPQGMSQDKVFQALGMKLGLDTPNLKFLEPAIVIAIVNAGFVPQGTVEELKVHRKKTLEDNFTVIKVPYRDVVAEGHFEGFNAVTVHTGYNLYLVIVRKNGGLYGAPRLVGIPNLKTTSTSPIFGWKLIKELPYQAARSVLPLPF